MTILGHAFYQLLLRWHTLKLTTYQHVRNNYTACFIQSFLSWFYRGLTYNPAAITQADINEYVSHYSAPGGLRAGFECYRAFPQDAIQNMNYSKTKLTMPVLAMGGGYIPVLGGNITMPSIIYGMKILAQNVQGY
jgi:hypothetical protein